LRSSGIYADFGKDRWGLEDLIVDLEGKFVDDTEFMQAAVL
jgi:hypothetical protein